ncbi:MAG: tripartite tricarboxylate transporter substrate binding protein [Treponemataceae bacterium]
MKRIMSFVCLAILIIGCSTKEDVFPSKDITLIVPFAAGGGTDSIARILAKSMEEPLGKNIIIENRTGGSGAVGMTTGAKAKNNGYTITMVTRELVTLPLLDLASIDYKDFDTLALINIDPTVLLVHNDSPYTSFQDFVLAAQQNPNEIAFASTAKPNFYLGALEQSVGIKLKQIPFNGAGEAIPAVLGRHAEATLVGPGEALSQVEGGTLRALAILHDTRIDSYPNTPTLRELGYDATTGTWRGLSLPRDTPEDIKNILAEAVEKAVVDPVFVDFMKGRGFGLEYKNAQDFEVFIQKDQETLQSVVQYIKSTEN